MNVYIFKTFYSWVKIPVLNTVRLKHRMIKITSMIYNPIMIIIKWSLYCLWNPNPSCISAQLYTKEPFIYHAHLQIKNTIRTMWYTFSYTINMIQRTLLDGLSPNFRYFFIIAFISSTKNHSFMIMNALMFDLLKHLDSSGVISKTCTAKTVVLTGVHRGPHQAFYTGVKFVVLAQHPVVLF